MEVQTRRKSRSGEDLRTVGASEALLGPTKKRPATAGRRFARGHQIQPLFEEEQERPTLPFDVWSSLRRPDPLTAAEDVPSTSRSLQQPISGRAVRKIVPVEEERTPENTSVDLDIFTKTTTDPATGDIIQPDGEDDDEQDNQDQQLTSQSLLAPPQLAGEQHGYIPYNIAKETIAKICDEMKKMKARHVKIVDEIDVMYREIEAETQQQFNNFVQRLKNQYSQKSTTFKQVIELYQEELKKNKNYWQSKAESLATRNRELLQENQALYKNNKKGFELLEAEKEQAINKLTEKVEREKKRRREECQKAVTMIRTLQAQQTEELQQERQSASQVLEATKAEHHSAIEKHAAEIAALREELELAKKKAEQQTVQIEQAQLQKTELPQVEQAQVQKTKPVPKHRVDAQREVLTASIQSSLRLKQKELDSLQHQLQAVCHLIRSEDALQTAVGGMATSLQEQHLQLKNTETDLQQQLESWKTDFRASHSGAEPTEDDWSEDVQEMNQKLVDTCNELTSCTAKLSLIQMLRNVTPVEVPVVTVTDNESSKQPVVPVATGELPVVPTGQPIVEEYKEVIASLEKGNIELVSVNEQLSEKVTSLEKENTDYTEELQRLRAEVQALKEGAVVAAGKDITIPGEEEKKDEGALSEDHSDEEDEEGEKQDTDEEESEEELEVATTAEELQASTSQHDIPSTDKAPVVTSPQSEAPAFKPKPTRRPTTIDNKSPTREPAKEKQTRTSEGKGESAQEIKKLREQLQQYKKQQQNDAAQIKSLKSELKSVTKAAATGGSNIEDKKELKKKEKEIKELVKQFEITKKNLEKAQSTLTTTETELKELKKSNDKLQDEFLRKQDELSKIEVVAKQAVEAQERVEALSKELKAQAQELKTTTENYNSERILRKKYYNMIEDMKGKIRVYCRARPLSKSEKSMSCQNITESPDEYTINVHSSRGLKEFQFDRIFLPEHGQEMVFEDTHNLVQSAVDGYNVCIFAYGQTGSGKTYTMIGGLEGKKVVLPGIAPRAFERIFQLANENSKKFSFKVSSYMLELYNDRLLDLFNTDHKANTKLDIKKDKKGMVFVQGSIVKEASTSDELYGHFECGSQNRHTASTKMNSESSRSHLIIGVVIESTNLTTGTVTRGKLSLVDLAGSERAAKTEASAEQLKEAQSINKSLSALGDVISALSSGQDFVPYRNNKLTLLMQDSLGGNAKTLMFVNISPADYNMDETVISLTYASRVKLITNDAQKNADNKEISKLKAIIAKLRRGEDVDDEE